MARYAQSAGYATQVQACYNSSGSDISYAYAVAIDTSNPESATQAPGITLTTGAFDFLGITLEAIPSTYTGRVVVAGKAVAIAGSTVTNAGTYLKSNSAGKLVPATASTDVICAKSLDAAATNDYFEVQLMPNPIGGATT